MTAKMLLEQYMAERHALGFVSKTDEGCIRRFLRDYKEPEDIQYVLDSLKDNPPHIRNIKKYLLAALYNAPLTIENYYAAQINHDLYGRNRGDVNWK